MTMLKYYIIVSVIALLTIPVKASEFSLADEDYKAQKYETALSLYLEGIEKEGISAGVYYNLGNVYYKLGKDADAMLCYERAKKLDPRNEQINNNLEFLKTKVLDANKGALGGKAGNVEEDRETLLENIYRIIAIERNSNSWAVFAVMAFILFLLATSLYVFTPNVLARKTGFFSGLVFLGFTIIFLIFSFLAASEYENKDNVILMEYSSALLNQPNEKASAATTQLHGGTKLKVVERKTAPDGSKWLKVKLNHDNSGWVKESSIEAI